MDQREINDAEWRNPENWTLGVVYHSRKDNRFWVPQWSWAPGWTINVGHPSGPFWLSIQLAAVIAWFAFVAFVAWL